MTMPDIAARVQRGLDASDFADSLKFDCGDDGVIVIADRQVTMTNRDTDCTIRITSDNLAKLVAGKLNPMTGVMMGKLKVSGDVAVAMRLGQLLKQ